MMPHEGESPGELSGPVVSSLLRSLNLKPTKGKGQNFLTSQIVVDRIAELVQANSTDLVVEVGPGLGALTSALAERAGRVVAIELDDRLADHLRQTSRSDTLRVVTGDALTIDPVTFLSPGEPYLFAANLPYSVGAAIVRRFLELEPRPLRMVVMLQREVAERIAASPPDMSILGVAVQLFAEPEIAFHVPPDAFKPRPKVESSVIVLVPHAAPRLPVNEREAFFTLVHAGFHQKRKQLANSLSSGLQLPKDQTAALLESADIAATRRAQTLSVDEWLTLYRKWRFRDEST